VNTKLTESDVFTNKMDVNFNMLCHGALGWKTCTHNGDVAEGVQFAEELSEPNTFDRNIAHRTILSLRAEVRHSRLLLAGPGHQGLTEEDSIT
jgi:hypothetical protein